MNRNAVLLLSSIGLTGIGSWIYFIALNLMIFNQTGSAAAVGLLYIIRPAAALLTSFWCGSLVDHVQKKRLILLLTLAQSLMVAGVGLFSEILWTNYLFVFVLQVLSSIFQPASMSFTTQLIPSFQLHRFNAVRSLLDSGAFLLGPAIAGLLLANGSPVSAIYLNAAFLLVAAGFILFISYKEALLISESFSVQLNLTADWKSVSSFRRTAPKEWVVHFLFTLFVVMQASVDSLEVAFAKEVLDLSDRQYGILVSMAGAGIVFGSALNIAGSSFFHEKYLIRIAPLITTVGYCIFALSDTFTVAIIGVVILGTALSFANTGFFTFIQKTIPVAIMGRVVGFFQVVESFFTILLTGLFALLVFSFSIRQIVLSGVILMLVITICLALTVPGTHAKRNILSTFLHFTHVKRRILK